MWYLCMQKTYQHWCAYHLCRIQYSIYWRPAGSSNDLANNKLLRLHISCKLLWVAKQSILYFSCGFLLMESPVGWKVVSETNKMLVEWLRTYSFHHLYLHVKEFRMVYGGWVEILQASNCFLCTFLASCSGWQNNPQCTSLVAFSWWSLLLYENL